MFPCPVAIKQFLWDPSGASPAKSARTYCHGLQKMAEITARLDLRATEPYALLESHGLVVASWIEGPTLARSLFRGSAARTRELIRDAGIWLARLHHACGIERRSPDIAGMLAQLEAEISEKADGTGSLTRRALSLLRAAGPLLATHPVPWSRHYGDFKPANLIVRECRLVAIDLELLFAAPTVSDAAHFLNHLQLGILFAARYAAMARISEADRAVLPGIFGCRRRAAAAPAAPMATVVQRDVSHDPISRMVSLTNGLAGAVGTETSGPDAVRHPG